MNHYLDTDELAKILGCTVDDISFRLMNEPWRLPPIANLGLNFPLRWRESEVSSWMAEVMELPT